MVNSKARVVVHGPWPGTVSIVVEEEVDVDVEVGDEADGVAGVGSISSIAATTVTAARVMNSLTQMMDSQLCQARGTDGCQFQNNTELLPSKARVPGSADDCRDFSGGE